MKKTILQKESTVFRTFRKSLHSVYLSLFLLMAFVASGHAQTIAGWAPAGLSNYGTNPWGATTTPANVTIGAITRGAGVTTTPTAPGNFWGGNAWTGAANQDIKFTVTAQTGYELSLSNFNLYYRRSGAGPSSADLSYSIGSGPYTSITTLSFSSSSNSGADITGIVLSSITALQNVPAGTIINFRILPTGGVAGGNWGIYSTGLRLNGTVTAATPPCTATTGLAAAGTTTTTSNLSWNTVSGAVGYQYTVNQSSTAPSVAGTATTGTTYNATSLTPGTTYYLHVRTNCGSSNFSGWTTISFTTLAPCAAPTGLAAANETTTSADLSWSPVSGAAGYEYTVDQVSTAPSVAGTATTATTFAATTLTANTTYYLHVRTNCGSSNFSDWETISFTTEPLPCAAPTTLASANETTTTADLSWDAVTGITGYEYVVDQIATAPAVAGTATTSNSYNATLLTANTTYYLHVRINCGPNFSTWETISFTTEPLPCAAPTTLASANETTTTADLSWDAVTGITGYEYVVDQIATAPAVAGTATTANSYNATLLTANTTYYLHVRINCGPNFSVWETISFTTEALPCAAPTTLASANETTTTADLSWDAVTGITGYEYVVDQIATAPAVAGTATTANSYNATTLTANTTYYLHVRINCGPNFSAWETIAFTTEALPCAAPTTLVVSNETNNTADLSWDAVTGITGYEYVVDQTATAPVVAGTPITGNTHTATSLLANSSYYAHVRINCGPNFSDWTTVSFTTLPNACAAPTGLAAANETATTADLSWDAVAGITGYEYVIDEVATAPLTAGAPLTAAAYNETALTANTTYYLHVRINCGPNFSAWETISFTTLPAPCAAPTTLAYENETETSADLSWDVVTGITGYEYVIDEVATAPTTAGTPTTTNTHHETGLTGATTYYLHVRINCGLNFSDWTTLQFATLTPTSCGAPIGLNSENETPTTADLSWDAITGIVGFEYIVDQLAAAPIGTGTATTATTYQATALTTGATYYLHVRTNCDNTTFSNWTTLAFVTPFPPCDAPTGLTAGAITAMTAELSWTAVAGSTGYEYVISQNASLPLASGLPTTATNFPASGLSANTTYNVFVRNNCGGGNFSEWTMITFTTTATLCAAPSGLAAAGITSTSANISWNVLPSSTSFEYVVNQSANAPTGSGTPIASTSMPLGGLTPGTTYRFHLRGRCNASSFSEWITITFTTLSTAGIEDLSTADFQVYPNPVSSSLQVVAPMATGEISVLNIHGQVLQTISVNEAALQIDMSAFESGLYFIRYATATAATTKNIIKQ